MKVDVAIVGAGLSGLAAGIRLAHFGRDVCIFERHYAYGGLNSYYRLNGRDYDVGLHALTNYVPPDERRTPLPRLLRQLRISRDELELCEQNFSEIRFPEKRLRFTNRIEDLTSEVAREFPTEIDNFRRLLAALQDYDDTRLDAPYRSTREALGGFFRDPMLTDMLLCPIMYYGSAEEQDMDFTHFVTLFKSILCEGFARPRGGVRTMIRAVVRRYRAAGGKLRMRCGVRRIDVHGGRAVGLTLDNGESVEADVILSCAGWNETLGLCGMGDSGSTAHHGRLSFVEMMAVLDRPPGAFGHDATIVFYNDAGRFTYARPADLVDVRSGVVACPNNYENHEDLPDGLLRMTWLANFDRWSALDAESYAAAKAACFEQFLHAAERFVPGIRSHVIDRDVFTPCTIARYTGHLDGAVYGAPRKVRDGRTPVENLYICGTDQGYLGIIGAMFSGVTIANLHVLMQG